VSLCFEAGKRVVEVNGALVRDFRPDEPTLARRLRAVTCEDGTGDTNNTRGMEVRQPAISGAPKLVRPRFRSKGARVAVRCSLIHES
jgi:hypothetical protein